MPASRKGTNFKEFASTLRYPPLQFDNPATSDPLQTPRAQFLKDFAVGVVNDILKDIKEDGLEVFANEYNKAPFKAYTQKIKEDETLKNPVNKAAKAALVDRQNLRAGDPFAEVLNDIVDSITANVTFDSTGVFAKGDNGAIAREKLLSAIGVNSIKLLGFVALSSIVRTIPIERVTEFNIQQYTKYLDPVFLLTKLIDGIKNKKVSESINDFKVVGRFINSVLTSTQFESKMQQAYLDYLATQPDLPPGLQNIAKFDEVVYIVNPDNIGADTDEQAFRSVSTITLDLLQNGKLGIDLKIVSKDVNGNILGDTSLNSLSQDLTGLLTGAQDDLQSMFDMMESCELPDVNMFNKYRNLGVAIKEFFKGFKPIRLNKIQKPKIKIPDRFELIESALLSAVVSLFYVATSTLFKIVLAYLQKLVPDLSCAQISAMIVPEEELGPRNQNLPTSSNQLAMKIADEIRKTSNSSANIDVEDITRLLSEIATSIGMFNGLDIAALNEFISIATSVLTDREYCELLNGNPTQDTLLIINNIIDTKFQDAGISKAPEDIIRFFSSIASLSGVQCDTATSFVDMPANTVFCATPEYYNLYNDLRIALLQERGLEDNEIEVQINKVCEINSRQAQQFLDLLNSDNPLDSMIPLIETGNPNCGINNTIEPINELVKNELNRSYSNIFEPIKETLDLSMIGDRGMLTTILSGKNGLSYPNYLKIPGKLEPKNIASWMRLSQEEFCSLEQKSRLASTPFLVSPDPLFNAADPTTAQFVLTDEDKERLRYLASLTQVEVEQLPPEQVLTYEDLFSRIGNVNFGVRGASFSGIYDLVQSSIGKLSVNGTRQNDLAKPLTILGALPEETPGFDKNISFGKPDYRVKTKSFFMLPISRKNAPVGQIKTKIIDFYPASILNASKLEPLVAQTYQYAEYISVTTKTKASFDSIGKSYELKDIVKEQEDYFVDLADENTTAIPNVSSILKSNQIENASTQSLVFAELVLGAIQQNVGISLENIPNVEKFTEYLNRDLYNYVFNSFLDGMFKIPAFNGKNSNFGITDQRVNTLNSSHVNTVTGELDPVIPEDFGGTEFDPSYYFYNKLSDDWKNLFYLYTRERSEEFTPIRTPLPDFQYFTEQASELYLKLREDQREATDYSNQTPFDLIISKSSLVSMNALIDMMIKVFCFEHYYKGFSFLNTVEITDNVFDNVYFDFLAKRFKDYAVASSPKAMKGRKKNSKFYYMLMELYIQILLRKKEAKLISLTPVEESIVNQIVRKSNIWKFGIPKDNLTPQESAYLEAYSKMSQYEVPGYPVGTISSGIAKSQGSLGPMNKIFAEAKKQRQEQIRLRNAYWNLIMEDCEPLFELLLRNRLAQEMDSISKQLSILNPDLIKENTILSMPVNGGPIVQNGEKIPADDGTAYMRNIYSYHPALMYSAGNILISDNAFKSFYGSMEDNNDRNFNGFLFNRFYKIQPHGETYVSLKSEPKEPVYSFSETYDGDISATIGAEFRNAAPLQGQQSMDMFRYSPDFLTPSILNYIELNKRDIVVNEFLLDAAHSKAGVTSNWDTLFKTFRDNKSRTEYLSDLIAKVGTQKFEEYLDNLAQSSVPSNLRGTENELNSVKRYKVFKAEGSVFKKLGSDAYVIGGEGATNMPLVISQVPAPVVLEQYINLVQVGIDFFPRTEVERGQYVDPNTGLDVYTSTLQALQETLYNTNNRYDAKYFGNQFKPVCDGVFLGPTSLTTFIYWLGSSGFFNGGFAGSQIDSGAGGEVVSFLDMPVRWFFKPGTFRYGVRLLLIQPNSNLTLDNGVHSYIENEMLAGTVKDEIRFKKVMSKETGYSIPLFVAEEQVDWTFRDLKTIYDAYLSSNNQDGFGEISITPTKWIDHTPLTRLLNIRLFNSIICSEDYKKLFDFCVPLRYFASLSAIYTTKAFTDSIGSSVDWGGTTRVNDKVFYRKEQDINLPFYESIRKLFYYSYNSFDPSYDGEGDDLSNSTVTEDQEIKTRRPVVDTGNDALVKISEIQNDILTANMVDPLYKEGLGDLRQIIGSGFERILVPDPTNACGYAKNKETCD
jgi:hypothetical protein